MMTGMRKILAATSASMALAHLLRTYPAPTVRVDFADGPDRPAYQPSNKKPKPPKPKPPKPDTRAKVKAARKQRRMSK
jgi:hypothetical protein